MEHTFIPTNDINLHAVQDGPVDEPLVISLERVVSPADGAADAATLVAG